MNTQNDNLFPDPFTKLRGSGAVDMDHRPQAGHEISRMNDREDQLVPRQLEQRRMIHPEASVRQQSDAFREIRTRLLELAGARNFITLIVSVSPGSGGSFVASNLAAAFAFDQSKTSLLIDCNLRYPKQDKSLGVDPKAGGLLDFLEHPRIGIASVLYPTGIARFRLIPAGRAGENCSEYFSSFRMRALLDSLRCRYEDRYIFLDGPAIKGSPDARILSDLADYVVVVAGAGRDTPASISQAISNFEPQKLAGVVFNQAS